MGSEKNGAGSNKHEANMDRTYISALIGFGHLCSALQLICLQIFQKITIEGNKKAQLLCFLESLRVLEHVVISNGNNVLQPQTRK